MKLVAKTFQILFALAVLTGAVALVALIVGALFSYLSAVPKELAVALVAAAATVLVATVCSPSLS